MEERKRGKVEMSDGRKDTEFSHSNPGVQSRRTSSACGV